MFVYEEKILKEYKVKVMQIVGWEGVWGVIISLLFIWIFYLLPGDDFGSAENPIQAFLQIKNNPTLLMGVLTSSVVIGPFNYYGTSLTKEASAMHRCLVDASRMCIVWFVSMCCSWETFKGTQALGYGFIILGNLLYYELLGLKKESEKEDYEEKETMKNPQLPGLNSDYSIDNNNITKSSENEKLHNIIIPKNEHA